MHEQNKFWKWYEQNYQLNLGIAAFLFVWQLIHLYWLSTDIVAFRIFGESFFNPHELSKLLIALVDYTEIPALLATSLVYIHEIKKRGLAIKPLLYLILLNSQWIHLFWLTDEFVVSHFVAQGIAHIPPWFAWIAILIDYLELPVIFETIKKFLKSLKN